MPRIRNGTPSLSAGEEVKAWVICVLANGETLDWLSLDAAQVPRITCGEMSLIYWGK